MQTPAVGKTRGLTCLPSRMVRRTVLPQPMARALLFPCMVPKVAPARMALRYRRTTAHRSTAGPSRTDLTVVSRCTLVVDLVALRACPAQR